MKDCSALFDPEHAENVDKEPLVVIVGPANIVALPVATF